jgi:hypothetical protein
MAPTGSIRRRKALVTRGIWSATSARGAGQMCATYTRTEVVGRDGGDRHQFVTRNDPAEAEPSVIPTGSQRLWRETAGVTR